MLLLPLGRRRGLLIGVDLESGLERGMCEV